MIEHQARPTYQDPRVMATQPVVQRPFGSAPPAPPAPRRRRWVAVLIAVAIAVVVVVAAAVGLAVASGAVSFHADAGPSLSGGTVASIVTENSGGAAHDVVCPDDLDGTVGATIRCSAVVDGRATDLVVTTTAVQGQAIRFDAREA